MKRTSDLEVSHVESLGGGVLVQFADGKGALFPASFLRTHLPWYELDLIEEESPLRAEAD